MDRRNHPVKEKKYEKQEINGNYEFFGNRCIFAPEKETKTITITS